MPLLESGKQSDGVINAGEIVIITCVNIGAITALNDMVKWPGQGGMQHFQIDPA